MDELELLQKELQQAEEINTSENFDNIYDHYDLNDNIIDSINNTINQKKIKPRKTTVYFDNETLKILKKINKKSSLSTTKILNLSIKYLYENLNI